MQCEKCTFHQVTCGHLTETNHNSHVSGVINTSHCHEWQWSALGWSLQHEMFACPAQCERAELVPVITADLLVRSPREIQTLRPVGAAVSHYVTVSCELCTAPCLRVSLSCLMCVTMSSMFAGEADSGPSLIPEDDSPASWFTLSFSTQWLGMISQPGRGRVLIKFNFNKHQKFVTWLSILDNSDPIIGLFIKSYKTKAFFPSICVQVT